MDDPVADRLGLLAGAIRRTAMDPSRFPDEDLALYRRNARELGATRARVAYYRALARGGAGLD